MGLLGFGQTLIDGATQSLNAAPIHPEVIPAGTGGRTQMDKALGRRQMALNVIRETEPSGFLDCMDVIVPDRDDFGPRP